MTTMNPRPVYLIKKYTEHKTMDGIAYSGDLYIDGAKAALVQHGGYGGEVEIYWFDAKGKTTYARTPAFDRVPADLPNRDTSGSVDAVKNLSLPDNSKVKVSIEEEFENFGIRRILARNVKTGVVFKAKGDHEWKAVSRPFTEGIVARIQKDHGGDVVFANSTMFGMKPIRLPDGAEPWVLNAFKGMVVVRSKATAGAWVGLKAKMKEPGVRDRLFAKYGTDAEFLSDILAKGGV